MKDSTIRRITKEIGAWRDSGLAMEGGNPGVQLDNINFIRANSVLATCTYGEHFEKHGRSEMLSQACDIALEQVQPYQFDVLKRLNLLPPINAP